MGFARICILLLSGWTLSATSPLSDETASVFGFQEWKSTRIGEAEAALARIEAELQQGREKAPALERPTPGLKSALTPQMPRQKNSAETQRAIRPQAVDPRLRQARLNIEIARELSVNDYYILYLSQIKEKSSLVEAAKKMAPEEIAELVLSLQSLQKTAAVPTDAVDVAPLKTLTIQVPHQPKN